ncbi:RNA polymerase sigma factor [Daejeonella lutea]|uniref:RNA polymerase sigma-70 factor, ECF subfamily n=1 Tax=Daejeonella lutea TaxID=572036 RepID=A0A1T5ERU6_9SPHI|nr:RNA polymerase sigma factor [Daejeonella lutea]SKB86636.1 RNA polymerase sigma-70 factor, ECF subfamily [Daejeonella lutea]
MKNSLDHLPENLREGCIRGDTVSQKKLYYDFYGFALAICLRYARDRDEANEILNEGFFKALTNLTRYDGNKPFLPWLGRIMTNTAIDHYRSQLRHQGTDDIDELELYGENPVIDSKLNYDDLIKLVQALPPGYRAVFNLYAIDGFTHDEIAEQLGISPGTSKSNLFKARQKLVSMLENQEQKTEQVVRSIHNNNNEQYESKPYRQFLQAGT